MSVPADILALQRLTTLLVGYIRKMSTQTGCPLTYDQWVTKYGADELKKAGL